MNRIVLAHVARKLARTAAFVAALAVAQFAFAGEMEDRVRSALAPPASIVEHAEDLHLSLAQRTAVQRLSNQYQAKVQRLQADLLDATERLVEALEAEPIAKDLALAELAKVNTAEAEIKRLHLDLWIQCNAQLRPLQRKQAIALAAKDKARGPKPLFQ